MSEVRNSRNIKEENIIKEYFVAFKNGLNDKNNKISSLDECNKYPK